MTNMNLIYALGIIITILLFILDVATRGIPITLANIKILDLSLIAMVFLFILDFATKGKYRTRHMTLILLAVGLILGTICGLSYSNF